MSASLRSVRFALFALSLLLAPHPGDAAIINVPADQPTIQAAVTAAAPNDLIQVAAGTYTEQVLVSGKNLIIRGAGVGSTTVKAPAALATMFTTAGPNKPVITATATSDEIGRAHV